MDPETLLSLPGNLMGLLGLDQSEKASAIAPAPDATLIAQIATALANAQQGIADDEIGAMHPATGQAAPAPQAARQSQQLKDMPLSALAEEAVRVRVSARDWDKERARDVGAAAKLFIAANGDIPFSRIKQQHLAATVALFSALPTKYGFTRKDPQTGERTQETIGEALKRGQNLKLKWSADPVAAERDLLPTVGLSAVTHNKHLTWLSALVNYAAGAGRPAPQGLNFTILRMKGRKARSDGNGGIRKKNTALVAFSADDLRHLLSAPIWTGCAGLWRRFEPGDVIFHDAWYWAPLIIALTGCRSDEGTGLALTDVALDAAVPFFHFRENGLRRVKTASSDRKVPIHPKLIALGFADYVRAMRGLGHRALFPELLHKTMSFDHNFYDKIFEPLRACQFPGGTSRKRGRKDVDVRSIRSRCISHLRDVGCPKELAQAIVGHEVGDVTSDIYEEDPDPALLFPWVEKLEDLIPDIAPSPLNLRPPEWQKCGSPRGRPEQKPVTKRRS